MGAFDLERFYTDVNAGKQMPSAGILEYIGGFDRVVIWGAGNLGAAVGKKMLQFGINVAEYWDKRHAGMPECNGIPVREAFRGDFPKKRTLVVHCIVNGSRGAEWAEIYCKRQGYDNVLKGMEFFAGFLCPLHENTPFDISVCTGLSACSLCNCKKYIHLCSNGVERSVGALFFQLMTFIVTTRCSLRCESCGQRLHEYPAAKIQDYPLEAIKRDADIYFSSVDFTGMVSIIGGEPFLHRDIGGIVRHILRYDNFGLVNITTNGVCGIVPGVLEEIAHPRAKISFSLYREFLSEEQNEIIEKNIELVSRSGVACSTGTPLWGSLQPLEIQNFTEDFLVRGKATCLARSMTASIRNGMFNPCSIVEAAIGIGSPDLREDSVPLHEGNFRERLKKNMSAEYYQACRYCSRKGIEIPAGRQLAM